MPFLPLFTGMGWSTYGYVLFLRGGLEYIWVCVVSQRWVGVHMDVCAYNTIMMSVKSLKCYTGSWLKLAYLWGKIILKTFNSDTSLSNVISVSMPEKLDL